MLELSPLCPNSDTSAAWQCWEFTGPLLLLQYFFWMLEASACLSSLKAISVLCAFLNSPCGIWVHSKIKSRYALTAHITLAFSSGTWSSSTGHNLKLATNYFQLSIHECNQCTSEDDAQQQPITAAPLFWLIKHAIPSSTVWLSQPAFLLIFIWRKRQLCRSTVPG